MHVCLLYSVTFDPISGNSSTAILKRFHIFEDLSRLCKSNDQPRKDNSITFLMYLVTCGDSTAFSRDID